MRRVVASLLTAYAAAITVVAAWLGCRLLIYHRLFATLAGAITPGAALGVSFEQILNDSRIDAARILINPIDQIALVVASVEWTQMAVVAAVVFVSGFGLHRIRHRRAASLDPAPEKD